MTEERAIKICRELEIEDRGRMKNGKYVIELNDSEEYAYYYSLLDYSDLDLIDSSSVSTEFVNVLTYKGEDYIISLNSDFNENYYCLIIEDSK